MTTPPHHPRSRTRSPQDEPPAILVVDDDAPFRQAAEVVLTGAGYRVLGAADGEAALRIARDRTRRVDLMLVALSLPDMAGPELVRQSHRPVPVLYVSDAAHDLANAAPLAGYGATLGAPFELGDLLYRVGCLLGRRPEPTPRASRSAA